MVKLTSNGAQIVNKFNQNYGQKTIIQNVELVGNKKYKIIRVRKKKKKKKIVMTI